MPINSLIQHLWLTQVYQASSVESMWTLPSSLETMLLRCPFRQLFFQKVKQCSVCWFQLVCSSSFLSNLYTKTCWKLVDENYKKVSMAWERVCHMPFVLTLKFRHYNQAFINEINLSVAVENIPKRKSKMGTATTMHMSDQIDKLKSQVWRA